MYEASQAFHDGVANGNHQMALLIFSNAVFTNEDINVTKGIQFSDYFNLEEDMAIGQTPSNEISFGLFNDARLLNDYGFGEFLATIGVHIGTDKYQQFAPVMLTTNYASWTAYDTYPYLKRNNVAVSAQPGFVVKSMLGYDGKLWAFSNDGRCVVYNDKDGANITNQFTLIPFMAEKSKGWAGRSFFYNKDSRILFIYDAGDRYRYEFVPLGWFVAERPKAPDVIEIDMTCYDFMQKFEEDMPDSQALKITYPATIKTLLEKMCAYVGVPCKATSFINSGAKITKEPDEFKSSTMRDVLKWIGEAACGNIRFDRDGNLIIDWIRQTGQSMTPTEYATFDPYWYETKTVTKLYNRGSDGSYDNTQGTGDEGYLIQDNPLLKGVN